LIFSRAAFMDTSVSFAPQFTGVRFLSSCKNFLGELVVAQRRRNEKIYARAKRSLVRSKNRASF
jgi:hypothetical protein